MPPGTPTLNILLTNFRLSSFEVLGGLAVIVEYDKIIDDGNTLYGVEETKDPNVLRFKALQALTGTLLLPWLPYRVDESLLPRTGYPGLALRFPSASDNGGANTIILDMIGGELSMTAKIAALMPAPRTRYAEILSAAAQNTAQIIESTANDDADRLLAEILGSITQYQEHTVRKNLHLLSDLILGSGLTEDEAYNKQLSLEGHNISINTNKIIILAPNIHGEYEVEELVKSLLYYIRDKINGDIEFYIAGFYTNIVRKIESSITRNFSRIIPQRNYTIRESTSFGAIRSDEDAERAARKIAAMGGTGTKLYTILLDAPDTLLEHLQDKISGQHLAIITHRIRYKIKTSSNKKKKTSANETSYEFDTKPTVVVIR